MKKLPSMLFFIFGTLMLSTTVGQESWKKPTFHPGVIKMSNSGTASFLTKEDKPIHLGDNRGKLEDIPGDRRNLDAPKAYGWKFELADLPTSASLFVSVYSISSRSTGCYTIVRLNRKKIANLSKEKNTGNGITTTKTISIPSKRLKTGPNELVISEDRCVGKYKRPTYNDSLVREARLQLTY